MNPMEAMLVVCSLTVIVIINESEVNKTQFATRV